MKPLPKRGAASLSPVLEGLALLVRAFSRALRRPAWAPIACVLAATAMWSEAHASDPIEEALSLVAEQRHDEAREVLDSLLARDPDAPGVRLLLGILRAREGNFTGAISVFEDLRDDFPDMFEAHNNLAVLYAELGRLDDARGALIAALELRPDAVVFANLGDVYTRLAQRAYAHARQLGTDPAAASPPVPKPAAPAEPVSEPPAQPADIAAAEDEAVAEPVETVEAVSAEAEQPAPEEEEPASAAEPEPALVQTAAAECVHAGSFDDLAAATEAVEWIQSREAELAEIREEQREVVKNHRVYWPVLESREAARAKASEFRSAGAGDVAVIGKGPLTNAVSFGVFRSESNMRRRVADLEKLGISPSTETNKKMVSEYMVEARIGDDHAAFDNAWINRFPEILIRYAACTADSS